MIDKIICIGKNYPEHARELGDAVPEHPVIFLKPASILIQAKNWNETVTAQFPENSGELHHEIEIVLRVAKDVYQLKSNETENIIDAVTLGLDMTLRTRQAQLKKAGHPWTTAKVFKDAAIIGPWINIADFPNYLTTEFSLSVDNNIRQQGKGDQMSFDPNMLLVYISQFFPLCKGDLIFTGTPAGVNAIEKNAHAKLMWDRYSYQVKWI